MFTKFQGDQSWVQVTLGVILSNITPLNNLLLNSYFENSIIELHILYILNKHANFHVKSDIIYHSIHKLIFYTLFQITKT